MPRKSKIDQGLSSRVESSPPAIDKEATLQQGVTRRSSTAPKKPKRATKKTSASGKAKARSAADSRLKADPTEAIRLRAYFISERRRRLALPGDAESDWLEAKRQLLSEPGPR